MADLEGEEQPAANAASTSAAPLEELSRRVEESILSQYDERVPAPPKDLRRVSKVNLDLLTWYAASSKREGRLNEAVKVWQRCLRLDPHDSRAWLQLAKLAVNGRNFAKAQQLFEGGMRFCPDSSYLLQAYGVYQERQGNLRVAEEYFRRGIQANKDHAASWLSLGLLSAKVRRGTPRRLRDAPCVMRRPSTQTTTSPGKQERATRGTRWKTLQQRGTCSGNRWSRIRRTSRRIRCRTCAGMHRPMLGSGSLVPLATQAWAIREAREGNRDVAAKLFKQGDECYEQSDTFLLAAWAELEASRNNDDLAESLFQRCLRRVENLYSQKGVRDAVPYQMYGNFLRSRSQYARARRAFDRGTEINQAHLPTWSSWALMEANLEETEEARRLFELGLNKCRRPRGKGRTYMYWALLELQENDVGRARQLLATGLRADPQDKG
eukprot:scaffold7485_cov248-Pinguiococcus_pyrenoidosus.AAC.2